MEQIITEIQRGIEENYFLTMGKTELVFCDENGHGLSPERKSCFDYLKNKAYFSRDENDNVPQGIEVLLDCLYFNNSNQGRVSFRLKKELLQLQREVLGDHHPELAEDDNPIVVPYDGDNHVFKDKEDLDSNLDNYNILITFVNEPRFRHQKSLALINKGTPLLKQYLTAATMYNQQLQAAGHFHNGFKLWLGQKIFAELGEEIFEVKKKEYLKENVKIFQVYDLMSSTEKEKGPLTALVQAGLVPSFTSEYLLMLIKENIKGYELLLAHKDMDVHTKNIFCLYADDKVPVDKVVSLGQVNLINLDENTFLKELYAGEVNFNDLVLDGIELQDKERFQELKEEYLKHRFSNEQVKGIKLRALELSNQAQTHYNRAVQTELNLQRIPLVQRKGELVERLNRVRMELSFASLGNCREALRYLSFHGRYSVNNKPHFTTWQILQEPKNAIEITLTRCLDSYNQLKATPNELSSERVFKTIYLVRQALLEDDHVFTKEDTKPKEEQGSENKVSKLTIADLFATQPKENKK